jgi:hypothetical protein
MSESDVLTLLSRVNVTNDRLFIVFSESDGKPPSVCMRRWPDQTAHVFIYFLFLWSRSCMDCKQDIANLTVCPRNCGFNTSLARCLAEMLLCTLSITFRKHLTGVGEETFSTQLGLLERDTSVQRTSKIRDRVTLWLFRSPSVANEQILVFGWTFCVLVILYGKRKVLALVKCLPLPDVRVLKVYSYT